MKKAVVIHAWESDPKEHWYMEEKKLLEEKGYTVHIPKMPGGRWPKLDEWLKVMESLNIDEDTVMIGHSLGAPTILRYLETVGQRVNKVFSVAGFANKKSGVDEINSFLDKPFDWNKIRRSVNQFVVINEKDDPYVPLERGREIANAVKGEFIEIEGNIHFDKMDLSLINKRL